MARRSALIPLLALAVLAAHALALEWLTRHAQAEAGMRLMAAPMFTRLLQQETPPPAPVSEEKVPVAGATRPSSAMQSIAPSMPQQGTASAAPAEAGIDTAAAEAAPAAAAPEPVAASEPAPSTASTTDTASVAQPASASPAASPGLDTWPGDTRLNYRVGGYFRGELHGSARVQWQRQGERYQTRIDIDLGVVSLVMTSQGEVTAQGLAPRAYEETRAGKRRSVALQEARVVLSDGTQLPRPQGVQDTASQFVELSHGFASGQLPLEVGKALSFWMARPGGVDLWTYDVVDKEVLQTPQLGAVEAFHLKPRPIANPRGNIMAEMWFAPSLQYLPVRIRVSLGDAYLDLSVEKIEQR